MGKSLDKLSKAECYTLYYDMLANSDRRWDSGLLLAQTKDYGGAIASHISSMEEMVKAIIMLLDSKGFEFRTVRGMEVIIRRSHVIRHFIGFIMFVMNIFSEDLKKLIKNIHDNPSVISLYEEELKDEEALNLKVKYYAFKKLITIKKEFYWFEMVERLRQEGTHVDYDSAAKSPLKLTDKDYKGVLKRLNNVREIGNGLMLSFDSNEELMVKEIEKLKLLLKKDDRYNNIQIGLENLRKAKNNPFALVKKELIDKTQLDNE